MIKYYLLTYCDEFIHYPPHKRRRITLIKTDVMIIGAGAAGFMCGIEAAQRGRRVLILEKSNKPGKKILMSGGGRCNFTNLYTHPERYLSHNRHFNKSALNRYTHEDFLKKIHQHQIAYYEKTLGQLFCQHKSSDILNMFLAECEQYAVTIHLNQNILAIQQDSHGFILKTPEHTYQCQSLVIASGGLSIPTLGSSPFGYQIAEQFGLRVFPTRAGLVPFTLHTHDKLRFEALSGVSVECLVTCKQQSFRENLLFTHRGLSGPAMLQISSYWLPGDPIQIKFLPDLDLFTALLDAKTSHPDNKLKTWLSQYLPKRLLTIFLAEAWLDTPLKQCEHKQLKDIAHALQQWSIKPNGTEGYRTAEVTLGGVDCNELSSQTFEAKKVPGLYFIGEVVDVSGWLGGYNFQWAWSSGWAAGQVV